MGSEGEILFYFIHLKSIDYHAATGLVSESLSQTMASRRQLKKSLEPCTCRIKIFRIMSIFGLCLMLGFSFRVRVRKKGWFAITFTTGGATKSQGLFEKSSLESSLISNGKLMLEQFLKGMGGTFFLMGILMMSLPVATSSRSFRQMMCGTSHLELMRTVCGFMVSTWILRAPLISMDSSSSGIRAFTLILISSHILMGTSIELEYSVISGVLMVKTVLGSLTFSEHSAQTLRTWQSDGFSCLQGSVRLRVSDVSLDEPAKSGYLSRLMWGLLSLMYSLVSLPERSFIQMIIKQQWNR